MTMRPYSSYRASRLEWLGAVPTHWTDCRLRHVVQLNPSKAETAHRARDEDVSFVPMDAIGEDGSLRLDQTRPIGEVDSGYTYFRDGDVVLAKITPCFENGKGAIMRGLVGGIGFGTTELIVARPKNAVNNSFIHWLFNSTAFRRFGEGAMYGAGGQKRVPDDFVRNFPISLPPESEQVSIAAFLDRETAKIDALVEAQQRLIELLNEKRQAIISYAVIKGLNATVPMKDSGVAWLGGVPSHWAVTRFSRVVAISNGQVDPSIEPYASMILIAPNHIESRTGNILFLESAASQGADSGKYQFFSGDVLYSKIRPGLAKVALAPCDGLCSADMYSLRSKENLDNGYLKWLLLSEAFTKTVVLESDRVAMPKINREKLNEILLCVPPIEEQNKIHEYLERENSKAEEAIQVAGETISLLNERKNALISAAVTGKIDVREASARNAEAA